MFSSKRITTLGGSKFQDNWSFDANSNSPSDYIRLSGTGYYESILQSSFSVSVWLTYNDADSDATQAICGIKNDNDNWFYLAIHGTGGNDGKLAYYHKSDGNTNSRVFGDAFADGPRDWTHVVWTIKMNTATNGAKCYVDGVLHGVAATNGIDDTQWAAFDGNSLNMMLAGYNNGSGGISNTHAGKISEFAIYNTVLDANDVATIYNGREPFDHKAWSKSRNVAGWYRFGDGNEAGSGTTIYDMSGQGNNGTILGGEGDEFQGDTP